MAYKQYQRNRRPAYSRGQAQMATEASHSQPTTNDAPITYAWVQQIWKRHAGYAGKKLIVEAKAHVAIAPEVRIEGRASADLAQLLLSMPDGIHTATIAKQDEPYALDGHVVRLSKQQSGDYILRFTPTTKATVAKTE